MKQQLDKILNIDKNYKIDLYRAIFTNTFNGSYVPADIQILAIYREIIWIDRLLSKYQNKVVWSLNLANTFIARIGTLFDND